jgi:REP element-mobilizing transposase RayT
MPDHMHAIIIINNPINSKKSLSKLVGSFKSDSSKKIHSAGNKEFRWQRSFYDRIVRNENELYNIRRYIRHNPLKVI